MLHLHGKSCKSAVQFLPYLIAKLVTALCKQADGGLFADRKKKARFGTVYIWQCLVFVGGLWPNPDGDIWFLLYARKYQDFRKEILTLLGVNCLIQP